MSDRLEDVVDIALRVAEALEKVGASYSSAEVWQFDRWRTRATNDIDFVIDMAVGKVRELSELLGADFEVDGDMLRGAILHGRSANIFYLPLVLKIDFFGHPTAPTTNPSSRAAGRSWFVLAVPSWSRHPKTPSCARCSGFVKAARSRIDSGATSWAYYARNRAA